MQICSSDLFVYFLFLYIFFLLIFVGVEGGGARERLVHLFVVVCVLAWKFVVYKWLPCIFFSAALPSVQ